MVVSRCPTMDQLEAMLDEQLPVGDHQRLSAHIAACRSCQLSLERLTEDADRASPGWAGPAPAQTEPADQMFIDRLKRMAPHLALQAAPAPAKETGAMEVVRTNPSGLNAPSEETIRPPGAGEVGAAPFPTLKDYKIIEVLGVGGEGVVYKAQHVPLNRLVALKMLRNPDGTRPESLLRFRQEAETLARLHHPNIVHVHDVGSEGGRVFFAMEYVSGGSLAGLLRGQPLPAKEAAQLMEVVADAVEAAHEAGVLHRDLKPGNILLGAGAGLGTPKVSDFGLAKRIEVDLSLTRTGCLLGTPGYMAPEQAQGKEVGPTCDVYALGAVLYHLLTGRPPFVGAQPMDILLQVVHSEPVSLRRLSPQTPRDLEVICLTCLNRDSRRRYASAQALAEDLRRYRKGLPVQARPPALAERLWRWARRYPLPAGLLLAMILCLVFGCWYLSWLTDYLVRSAALESAMQQSDVLLEVNDSYTDVVKRAKAGKLPVTHDYASDPTAIPIPATFTIELGQQISDRSDTGEQIRLYSDYPFRSRRNGGPKDDYETDALRLLRANPAEAVYRFEEYKGRPVLRYATARRMQQTCVDCHNTHPDSPKTDWQVGDVRGVVEIIYPLDRDAARIREGLHGAFVLVGVVCASPLVLYGLALLIGRLRRGTGEGR